MGLLAQLPRDRGDFAIVVQFTATSVVYASSIAHGLHIFIGVRPASR